MKKIVLLLVVVMIAAGFVSCRKCEVIGRRIVGTWTRADDGGNIVLTFEKNGSMTITAGAHTSQGFYSFETNGKNKFKDVHLFIRTYDDNCYDSYVPEIDKDVLTLEPEGEPCPHAFVSGSFTRLE